MIVAGPMLISDNPMVSLNHARTAYQGAARLTPSLPQQRYLHTRATRLPD